MYLCYKRKKKKVRCGVVHTWNPIWDTQGQGSKFETRLGSMRPRFGGRAGHVGKREEAVWRCVLGIQEALGFQYCGKINYHTEIHSIHSGKRGTLVSAWILGSTGHPVAVIFICSVPGEPLQRARSLTEV